MPQNINNSSLTWTLKCLFWLADKLNCRPHSQTYSTSFLKIQRKWLLWNCVAGHEVIYSSRGFHSMQSLPLCPLRLYYILLHSGRKKKKKKRKQHTDRKFPPEPYNHCNADTLQPWLIYLTMMDRKTSLDSKIRVACSCVYASAFVLFYKVNVCSRG